MKKAAMLLYGSPFVISFFYRSAIDF